uniref:Interleukin-2 receptor subunit alpha n=1 Tax=Chelonoidis abingdonii TaxID=106734 RepID=A0A8C0IL98_CHEAB
SASKQTMRWQNLGTMHGKRGGIRTCNPPFAVMELINKVRYKCEAGYTRIPGESNFIVCSNDTGLIHWTTKASVCELHKKRKHLANCLIPLDFTGYCGIPSPVEHTTPTVTEYAVGQELHYKCLRGYDARTPTSDISTCKEEHGKPFWTRLSLLCTNDSERWKLRHLREFDAQVTLKINLLRTDSELGL